MRAIVCYILHSKMLDKFYVGITQEGVEQRLLMHNSSGYGNHFTSQSHDWEIYLAISCESVAQCMQIEKHIKKMKSRKYFENLKAYPEIINRLKQRYP